MRIDLPFEYSPFFKTYQYLAFFFGILQGGNPNTLPWIYCNFIFCCNTNFDCNDNILSYYKNVISRTPLISLSSNISQDELISIIEDALINGYYINGLFDEYYIPAKKSYGCHHMMHDYIITGFDDQTKTFSSAGYTSNLTYQKFSIPYSDFYNSIIKAKNFEDSRTIQKLNINSNFDFKFNMIHFCNQLYNYIKQPIVVINEPINDCHGLCSWKYLHDQILQARDKNKTIEIRNCRFLFEHCGLILSSINYLATTILNNPQTNQILSEYRIFFDNVKIMFNICLKYCVSSNDLLIDKLLSMTKNLYYQEHSILTKLLKHIIDIHASDFSFSE